MEAFIILLVVAFILLLTLVWTKFRTGVVAVFMGIVYALQIAAFYIGIAMRQFWAFVRGTAAPAVGAAAGTAAATTIPLAQRVLGILMVLILVWLIILVLLFILATFGIVVTGIMTGHWLAAFFLLLALFGWGMLSLVPRFRLFAPLVALRRYIVRPVVIGLSIYLLIGIAWSIFGLISPKGHTSIERSAANHSASWWNSMDRKSMGSEEEAGDFVRVIVNTRLYNEKGISIKTLKVGDTVEILDYKGKKKDKDGEGMTHARTPNDDGDFIKGTKGWVPSRALDLEKKHSSANNGGPWKPNLKPFSQRNNYTGEMVDMYVGFVKLPVGDYAISGGAANVSVNPYRDEDRICKNGSSFRVTGEEQELRIASLQEHLVITKL